MDMFVQHVRQLFASCRYTDSYFFLSARTRRTVSGQNRENRKPKIGRFSYSETRKALICFRRMNEVACGSTPPGRSLAHFVLKEELLLGEGDLLDKHEDTALS